jgi:hypothetical protein
MKTNENSFARVKDHKDIVRDMHSKAILSIDNGELENHKRRRAERMELQKTINDINSMKNEINDLKMLLHCILEKIG